jgi:hypothetical protein
MCDAILQCCKDLDSIGSQLPIAYGSRFYKVLPRGSRTRSLLADLVAWTTTSLEVDRLKQNRSELLHSSFLMDVLQAMTRRFMSSGTSISPLKEADPSCKYHSHSRRELCYRKKAERFVICLYCCLPRGSPLSPDKKRAAPADGQSSTAKRQR